ncbi:MAG TPA: tetratricopeptide repeat protein [Gemmatimonadaceae bacterium]|nr:tetratricopeptide repeat protein [Gemmatimonadaceae bacterium]
MKVSHRFALSAAGLAAALAVSVAPSVAGAQVQRQGPGPDTKRVLVTAFRGDAAGGVKLAEEIRNRVTSDFNIRTLMPVSKKDIDNTLVSSGYRPDSALSPNDIRELAKLVRGDEIIDGTVQKTPGGYKVNARFFLPRDVALSQPLINAEGNNLGDLAKQIVHEYDLARKQIPANQECENAIRDKKIDAAVAAARKGIATYPRAVLTRLCLASAFQAWKTTPDSATKPWKDSVLAVTTATTALDKSSKIAYQLMYDVYKSKNDTTNQMNALLGLMAADPTNTALREQVINELVITGRANAAVPVVKQLVAENPGDPQYLRMYWLVLRATQNWKESIPAGQAYVAADPSAADSNFYFRMVSDLASDSSYAKAAEMAATGAAKFPKSSSLLLLKAQNERKAGQIPAAIASLENALRIDPKAPGAQMLRAQLLADQGKVDEAVAAVKADVAADASNKERDAQFLLSLGNQAFKAGQASKKPEDFQRAIGLLQASEELNGSANAKFLLAASAYQALAPSLQEGKSWKCTDAKTADNYLTLITTNMPGGGSVSPDFAKQVLGAVPQLQQYISAQNKRLCK